MRVCIPHPTEGLGGPKTFVKKLASGLGSRGIQVVYHFDDEPYDVLLVINSKRHLEKILRAKRKGIKIIQRLGGINWLHRFVPHEPRLGFMYELSNWNMRLIRRLFADGVIYQSRFVEDWWNKEFGSASVPTTVIYNGVDLDRFTPHGPSYRPRAEVCVISVEGAQGIDLFDIAVALGQALQNAGLSLEVTMLGESWRGAERRYSRYPFVNYVGVVPNTELPYYYRGATFYVLTDVIAACPNSLLEALACGTPVLGYKASVLPELLDSSAGRCVEVVGDPWQGQPPGNLDKMVGAALEIANGGQKFREGARSLAEKRYGLDQMVDRYLEVFNE